MELSRLIPEIKILKLSRIFEFFFNNGSEQHNSSDVVDKKSLHILGSRTRDPDSWPSLPTLSELRTQHPAEQQNSELRTHRSWGQRTIDRNWNQFVGHVICTSFFAFVVAEQKKEEDLSEFSMSRLKDSSEGSEPLLQGVSRHIQPYLFIRLTLMMTQEPLLKVRYESTTRTVILNRLISFQFLCRMLILICVTILI